MAGTHKYDVAIVGGGIIGTAILYVLSNYTDAKRLVLVERRSAAAELNSDGKSNSQTLHFGDVETNYTEAKAKRTNDAARLVLRYCENTGAHAGKVIRRCQKLLLAVGEEEIEYADRWYGSFAHGLYGGLEKLRLDYVKEIEPNLIRGRKAAERIEVYRSNTGYMVDYGKLADSFIRRSKYASRRRGTCVDVLFDTEIGSVEEDGDEYVLRSGSAKIECKAAVFAAGAYSLLFAKRLGLADNLSIIATGGGFFKSRRVLNGKVYRVQLGKMPFAAVHGDPDMNNSTITRFGPVIYLPIGLEKGRPKPIDYVKTSGAAIMPVSLKILSKYGLFGLISRHMSYHMPLIGKKLFLNNEVRKIVPALEYSDISPAKGYGGISPRIVDRKKMTLNIGEERIRKDNAVFDISPSPGASSSLAIARSDAAYISSRLGIDFDKERFDRELGH